MSYLSGRIPEQLIVPVICGTEQGTAFFIDESRLLTARHVVRGYFNSSSAPAPILLKMPERDVLCTSEELSDGTRSEDVALLTIAAGEDYKADDELELLRDPFVPDLKLVVYGYPMAVAMGEALVPLNVRNRLEIAKWNDRAVVRDDMLDLKIYDGMSGAPVVNKEGRAVGIVTLQNNQTLNYLSMERLHQLLELKGVQCDTDWETEDDTLLGQGRSLQFCEEAVKTVGDRYMPKLHQHNEALEYLLDTCTDASKIEESVKHAQALAHFVEGLPQDKKDIIREDLKIAVQLDYNSLSKAGFALLERCCDYFDEGRFRTYLSFPDDIKLHQLMYQLRDNAFDWVRGQSVNSICLIGKAGTGKTHTLCHFSLHKQKQANIYLFFGTDYKPHESVIGHIKEQICPGESLENFNQGMKDKGRYAVVVIDAINEGLGCAYWNNHLGSLRSELEKYSHIKLVISIRNPFDKELSDLSEKGRWLIREVIGFTDQQRAIDAYFDHYMVDQRFKKTHIEAFKTPLFLKIFCETYYSMTEEEKEHATKRVLYKKYVAKKNDVVSLLADEDPEMNVADRYLSKLAHYSVFYVHCNPVLRQKARRIGQRICPCRFWEKDLMHACLSTSLLLDDLSADGGKAVMFEYENLGDYYKAEQWLGSKMDTGELLDWIVEEDKYLKRHQDIPRQKFEGAVKALFDCWWHQQNDVSTFSQVQSGGYLYDLYVESLVENDIPFRVFLDILVKLDKEQVNPIRLIRDFDKVSLDEALQIHGRLLSYPKVGSRDIIWTRYVNQMYEMNGDEYIGTVPVEDAPATGITDEERKYLICITWMLSSSHPRFRAILVRKLRKILSIHTSLITWLIKLFKDTNDPYVLSGLYCAVYGVVVTSSDIALTGSTAALVYHCCYERDEDIPQDLIVRQWTLKIIERAYHLDASCDYWVRIKTPFKPAALDKAIVPNYMEVKRDRAYFGLQQGSMMMHASIFDFEDFNRYILGANSHSRSTDYFQKDGNGKYEGVSLDIIMAEMAGYIMDTFGWNDKLGYLDNGKYSRDRSHNDTERIGKKFQWLAWYRINARMMDVYRVSKEQYFYGEEAEEKDLTSRPMPWNSSEVSRFDPTLDPSVACKPEAGLRGTERQPINGGEEEDWVNNNEYLPEFRYLAKDENGLEYVLLMGYDTTKGDEGKETFLFINAGFVHQEDAGRFAEWCKNQNFYGRWMPERRGMTEYLWNEYPWSDAYKTVNADYEEWDQPQDCPVKMMLSYEAQLQEDWEGIGCDNEYLSTAYMPCREMMSQMGWYCSEIRGVIKACDNHEIIALNTGHGDCINGLFIRKDKLDEYLRQNGYVMFYYVLGEKLHRMGGTNSIMKDLSGAFEYLPDEGVKAIQPLRVVERELPKRAKMKPVRVKKMDELAEVDDESSDMDFLDEMSEWDVEDEREETDG